MLLTSRARRPLSALVTLAAVLAGASSATAATQAINTSIPMACAYGSTPSNDIVVTLKGTAPGTVQGLYPINVDDLAVSVRVLDRPGQTPPNFIWGNVQSVKLAVSKTGVSDGTPTTKDLVGFSNIPFTPHADGGYGPIAVKTDPVIAEYYMGYRTESVKLAIPEITYGFLPAANATDPVPPIVPVDITCKPKTGDGTFATVTNASVHVDTDVALQCTDADGTRTEDAVVHIDALISKTTELGYLLIEQPEASIKVLAGPSSDRSTRLGSFISKFSFAVSGADPAELPIKSYGGLPSVQDVPFANGAWGPAALNFTNEMGNFVPSSSPKGPGPYEVRFGRLVWNPYYLKADEQSPSEGSPTDTCVPKAGQPPLLAVQNPATALTGPTVTGVSGTAWAGFGGLVRVRGTKLTGARYVTVGTKKVKPLFVLGGADAYIFAPALPKGQYEVSVTTAAGASAQSLTSRLTYR